VIAGVAAGAGTTTLATAMHGIDGGRWSGRAVDVLLCRAGDLAHAAAVPGASVLALRAGGTVAPAARAWLDRLRPRFGAIIVLPEVERWSVLDEPPAAEAARLLAVPAGRRTPELRPYADALLQITAALVHDGALAGGRSRPVPPARSTVPDPPPLWETDRGETDRGETDRVVPDPPGPRAPRGPRGTPVPHPGGEGVPAAARPARRVLWRGLAPVERPAPAGADRAPAADDLDDDALESPAPAGTR
jgi:hypothetical protein